MAFDEVRLPEDIERGANGGPGFKTNILVLPNGFEKRSQVWQVARGKWDISYGIQSRTDFVEVLTFFYARRGRARGFRFKDWSDYSMTTELIGTGDGAETDFQITKTYTSSNSYVRDITKIVASSYTVYVNGVEQTEGGGDDYTLDTTTGIISFNSAVTNTHPVTVTCEFDVPVRFDNDDLGINLQMFDAGSIPAISLVELRV